MTSRNFPLYTALAWCAWPLWQMCIALRRRRAASPPQRIAVFPQFTRIGDLVCATPVFRAIKLTYPKAHLAVVVSKKSWEIIKHNPRVDEIIFTESPHLIRTLRSRRFDISIALTNHPFPSVMAYLALIPRRIKTVIEDPSSAERMTDCLNTERILYRHHTYLGTHYLKLLAPLGIRDAEEVKEVYSTPSGDAKAAELLHASCFMIRDFVVGISVAAGNRIKAWPLERFAAVADAMVKRHGAKVVFLGAPQDVPDIRRTQELMRHTRESVIAADFAIHELPSLIKRFNLFISVDTGPVYIADALKVPLIDITGPCDPREQPPLGTHAVLVTPPLTHVYSSFVMKRAGPPAFHARAVDSITTEMVLSAAEKLLKSI